MPRNLGRRSRAAAQAGDTLAIPPSLLEPGTLLIRAGADVAGRIKRELEHGPYTTIRRERGSEVVLPSELVGEWKELLLPRAGSISGSSREARALSATARLPDLPPLYTLACGGSDAAQELLRAELRTVIEGEDWQELWILFGQIRTYLYAVPGAVQP